jgi:molybdopterin biosynthesis enzyme MoaB
MKNNSTYQKDLTAEQKMDILVDTVIDALHKVVERYIGTDKVADIRAALNNLIAHKQDVNALRKGMSYCTDNWIFGSVN